MKGEQLDHAWGIDNGQKTEAHEVGWECVAIICRIKFVTPWKES